MASEHAMSGPLGGPLTPETVLTDVRLLGGVLANMGDGVSIQSPEFRVLYQNPAHETMAGRHEGEYCYRAYANQETVCEDCPVRLAFERGGTHTVERQRTEDGKPVYVEINAAAVRDEAGEVVAGIEVVRNVTKRREAEEHLRQAQRSLEAILESVPYGVIIITRDKSVMHANTAALKALGYESAGELVGSLCHETLCPTDRERCPILDLGQELDRSERTLVTRDGRRVPILKTVVPVEFEGKELLLEAFVDISERKEAEEAVKRSLREKEVLLREIHHRVKNNMQIVSSLLRLQAGQARCEPDAALFTESQSRIRAMALVHEELYRSEDLSHINMRHYVSSLTQSLFRTFGGDAGHVRLEVEVEEIATGIDTAIPLGLVMNELLTNSLKYAFPGERPGRLAVRLGRQDVALELEVRDDGMGLPEGFDLREVKSMGMQLVRLLVEVQLKGSIELSGGEGTTFRIRCHEVA